MDIHQFEFIKRELISKVILMLVEEEGWDEIDAIRGFMESDVYDTLQREDTKVWHLSSKHLLSLFKDEMDGNLIWPDVI